VNDGYCGNLACEMNEWVGTKVTWYWYEMRPKTNGVVMINGMDSKCDAYEELIPGVGMKL